MAYCTTCHKAKFEQAQNNLNPGLTNVHVHSPLGYEAMELRNAESNVFGIKAAKARAVQYGLAARNRFGGMRDKPWRAGTEQSRTCQQKEPTCKQKAGKIISPR
ncbi:hypothetical protein Slin15195_G079460 [Septoria linicola]|uniref:Uncharacterized protein n=1 Tax=Septoria linicola TaxID=215465 RepID=A0A9Q9AZB4_9PEZI|nr:hypothetical protein Slin14017_G040660 [Septoria linicola]USW54627.1 hypothetical protein Slin15195_G079460 [Septoria linicola]